MKKTVFVVGLDDFNLRMLRDLPDAAAYEYIGLLSYDEIVRPGTYDLPALLEKAKATLERHPGSIDAIVTFWDFPSSTIMPILRGWFGLPGPSLEAVLRCEHKYWSRIEQTAIASEHVPRFCAVDPFVDEPRAQIALDFPFWIKPVKAHSSHLAFKVRHSADFDVAIAAIRAGLQRLAEPFNHILSYANLPPEIATIDGYHCIAEEVISAGRQCTLEGYVVNGEVVVYGVVDSIREGEHRSCLARYQYPSRLPRRVQARMIEVAKRFLDHAGYEHAPFNMEFFWDARRDEISLLEVNTRISKSHCPLFEMVDGVSHHRVMLDVALGERPDFPYRQGRYKVAAKFMHRVYEDGVVARVPGLAQIEQVEREFPGTLVRPMVEEGTRLAHLRLQDSYSFEIAEVFMGAGDQKQLLTNYQACLDRLGFRYRPVRDDAA